MYTSWLAAESKDWESQVGADKAVKWPTGTGGDGNDGVARRSTQTEGSVGYLSYDFAVSANLGVADIKARTARSSRPRSTRSQAAGGLTFPITPTRTS